MIAADHAMTDRAPPHQSSYAWAGALAVMRAIKQALDPENLMNPGKMLPPV
jgi:FAD/FMN-containing dehydrogenase